MSTSVLRVTLIEPIQEDSKRKTLIMASQIWTKGHLLSEHWTEKTKFSPSSGGL